MTSLRSLAVLLLSAAPLHAYDEIRFLEPFKLQAGAPAAVAAAADRYYVLDEKRSQLQILDADGKVLKVVGKPGSGPAEFSRPRGLAIDPEGAVFVADTGNSRVQVLDSDGKFVASFGMKGSAPGRLDHPEGVASAGFGRVFVSDTGNHRVQVFTREGVFLYGFGEKGSEPGKLKSPTRLFVDAGDYAYVLDSGNDRVQKFDAGAKVVKEYAVEGSDFALDPYGFLYILDPKPGKVREVAPDGFVPGAFGSRGSSVGQFKNASAIAIGPGGTVVVVDAGNARLQRIELTNKLKKDPVSASTASKLLVTGPAFAASFKAGALAARGERVYAYLPEKGQFAALGRDGKELLRFGRKSGKDAGATAGSEGLAASEKFGVFVADTRGDKMQRFDSSGTFVTAFAGSTGFFDSKKKEGRVRAPRGVAINEKGTVYAADAGNRRVDAFNPDGAFLFAFGPELGAFQLQDPVGVAWDPAGFVYVLDRKLKKVFKCEPSGGLSAAWGDDTGPGHLEDPVAIAYDGMTYVYVLDAGAKRVSVFHRDDGHWVTNFFAEGPDDRSLQDPSGLTIQGERLVVSDPEKGKVLAFTLQPLAAPPAAISTAAVEGVVELKWKASTDPWVVRYRVWRSTAEAGPWEAAGESVRASFKDSAVSAYQAYYYRVAAEAKTGDVGPRSEPTFVFVPGAFNRAPVEIASVEIGNLLPANYKWYLKNAAGKAVVANNVNVPFQNVKLSFQLKDFMDFPTETVIPKLEPQTKVELPLMATLNNKILDVTEETPIQAEVSVTYYEEGKPQKVSIAKPLRVYSRNGIIWDNPERVNAFITSNDTPVLEFGKRVRHEAPPPGPAARALNGPLLEAMRLWHAVAEAGVRFQASPNNPFEAMSQDPAFPVDYTQFPRETLKRKNGECDDLVTLFASLFEGANVRSALLDYPGHLALMFDTGEAEAVDAGLPESELVRHDGTWWVPLEATLVGSSFADAHRHAAAAYHEMEKTGRAKIIDPRHAMATFEPVTMPATEWSAPAPDPAALAKKVEADAKGYAESRYRFVKEALEARLGANPADADALNRLGLLEVEMGRLQPAEAMFRKAASADAEDAAAANNLGSVFFAAGQWAKAMEEYSKAAALDPDDAGIWLNMAKTAGRLKDHAKVAEYGKRALAAAGESDKPRIEAALGTLNKEVVR